MRVPVRGNHRHFRRERASSDMKKFTSKLPPFGNSSRESLRLTTLRGYFDGLASAQSTAAPSPFPDIAFQLGGP